MAVETVALHTNSQFSELIQVPSPRARVQLTASQLNMDLIRWGHLCEAALAYLEVPCSSCLCSCDAFLKEDGAD